MLVSRVGCLRDVTAAGRINIERRQDFRANTIISCSSSYSSRMRLWTEADTDERDWSSSVAVNDSHHVAGNKRLGLRQVRVSEPSSISRCQAVHLIRPNLLLWSVGSGSNDPSHVGQSSRRQAKRTPTLQFRFRLMNPEI